MFPVIAADGSRHAISIRGKNIVATRTTDNIPSLAVLLKAGYKVNFRVGTDLDPMDAGDLYTPKGKRIALVFAGNLLRLPMWSSPSRCESTAGIPAHQNPFAALVNVHEMSLAHALLVKQLKCRLSSCLLQIRYTCATIATDTRHATLICACTKPDKVAGTLQTFRLSLLISNVKHCCYTRRAQLPYK